MNVTVVALADPNNVNVDAEAHAPGARYTFCVQVVPATAQVVVVSSVDSVHVSAAECACADARVGISNRHSNGSENQMERVKLSNDFLMCGRPFIESL